MEFHDAANFLLDLRRFPPRPGVEPTEDLLAHLGDPHDGVPCVQVAGTNGKGSTARLVESALREAGLSVGLYTSPHLEDVRERIRVDGRKLPEAALAEFVERVAGYHTDRAADGDAPTFFETMTALALWEFGRRDVDVAVLEVGIGGRHDATSAVAPLASAVTGVALEHTDVLGDTVREIARDKAHVGPAGRPLVCGATGDARRAVRKEAGDVVTVGTGEAEDVCVAYDGREGLEGAVSVEAGEWSLEAKLPLLGAHQARNAGVAAALVRQIGDALSREIESDALARGLRNAHWPGRFEVMGREPLVVLDGAHNPDACERVAATLAEFDVDDLHVVAGAMADKDHRGVAAAFSDATRAVTCRPDHDRAETPEVVARAFEQQTDAAVEARADVAGAFDDALAAAGPEDCVLVTGSLYTVAEARERWTRPTVPKRIGSLPEAREALERTHLTGADVRRTRGTAVHRVLKTRVQPRQAQYLKEELLSSGGECVISELNDQNREKLAVLLMGTLAQFGRLVDELDGQPHGLAPLGDELRTTLGIDTGPERRGYPWEDGTAVMGVLNVTPDSFHDGGEYDALGDAVARAEEMVAAGADIVDVGGESTRPGADPVPVAEECSRVLPVIERLADLDAHVSIDTRKADVARAALEAGADILNDVSGLEDPEMRLVAAEYDVPVVVMHSIDTPVDPERDVPYDDVVEDVLDELTERVLLAEKTGLDRSQIIVDPGLGFGKSAAESFELLGRLGEFRGLGCPVLVGHSHKSMFELLNRDPGERLDTTVAATALAAERGADIVRVHDVVENRGAVDVVQAAADPGAFD